jgi:hypothetical protein
LLVSALFAFDPPALRAQGTPAWWAQTITLSGTPTATISLGGLYNAAVRATQVLDNDLNAVGGSGLSNQALTALLQNPGDPILMYGQYFGSPDLSGPVAFSRQETVAFDWSVTPPDPSLASDDFSVRWTSTLVAPQDGSYWHLGREQRPEGLRVTAALAEAGGLADSPAGRAAYAKYLAWQAANGPAGKNAAYVAMSRGWALGGDDFKANLQAEHELPESSQSWDAEGRRELREAGWAKALDQALRAVNHTAAETLTERKSAPWKVAVAAHLKATTQVENRWLAAQLHMGSPVAVMVNACRSWMAIASCPPQSPDADARGPRAKANRPSEPDRQRQKMPRHRHPSARRPRVLPPRLPALLRHNLHRVRGGHSDRKPVAWPQGRRGVGDAGLRPLTAGA